MIGSFKGNRAKMKCNNPVRLIVYFESGNVQIDIRDRKAQANVDA